MKIIMKDRSYKLIDLDADVYTQIYNIVWVGKIMSICNKE